MIFRLNKDYLVSLVKNEGLSSENYDSWLEDLKTRFGNDAGIYLSGLSMDSLSENRSIFNTDYSEKIKSELSHKYPYLTIEQVIITGVSFPDLMLYHEARRIYNETMETKKQVYQEYYKNRIPLEQEYESRLNLLTQYGQVLTQYPILIDFLSIGAEPDLAKIPIPKE